MNNALTIAEEQKVDDLIDNMKISGVFRNRLGEVNDCEIFLVTAVNNDIENPNYDPTSPNIAGSYYEVKTPEKTYSLTFEIEVKNFLKAWKHASK